MARALPAVKGKGARTVIVSVCLVFALGLAYANSLRGPFLFDDVLAIAENPTLQRLVSWDALRPPAGQGLTVEGRPLLNLSFALNHAISGGQVWSYHVLNVAIHLGAMLALFGVVRRTLRLTTSSSQAPELFAAAVALLWAVHPLQTESVTYVVQRAESLMGACALLTLYAFIRGAEPGGKRRWWFVATGICLAGALVKEVTAVVPVLVLLYDRTFLAGTFRGAWRARGRVHLALASSWLVIGALVLGSGSRGGTVGFGSKVAWTDYALTQFDALAHYLRLAVWPQPLVFDYGTVWIESLARVGPQMLIVVALVGGTLVALWRWPVWGFLGAWFLAPLAPTSLIPGNRQTMAEHRMYLSLVPFVVASVWLGYRALSRWPVRWRVALTGAIAGAFVGLTAARNHDYRSVLALYRDTALKRPDNAFARYNLGKCLHESGAPAEAVAEYVAAIRLNPRMLVAHYNLGNALNELGRPAEAERAFRDALALDSRHVSSHYNLGNALVQLGRKDEAREEFAAALRLAPDFSEARVNLGGVLLDLGRLDEAQAEFERALEREPQSPLLHVNLGHVHFLRGDRAAARREYETALRLEPNFGPARDALQRLGANR